MNSVNRGQLVFWGETLGPVAVVVKPGAQSKILAALAEEGLLGEIVDQN